LALQRAIAVPAAARCGGSTDMAPTFDASRHRPPGGSWLRLTV
jgi:hypothetical protein